MTEGTTSRFRNKDLDHLSGHSSIYIYISISTEHVNNAAKLIQQQITFIKKMIKYNKIKCVFTGSQ